jgi:hypothetical protein
VRFGLRDVLLGLTVIGLWLAGLSYLSRRLAEDRFVDELATIVAAVGVISALSCCAAVGPRRWIAVIALVIAVPGFVISLEGAFCLWDVFTYLRIRDDDCVLSRCLVLSMFAVELIAFVVAGSLLVVAAVGDNSSKPRHVARAVLVAAGLLAGLPLALVYCRMLWLEPIPSFHAVPANHYSQIVDIARRFNRYTTPEVSAASVAELLLLLGAANHVPAGPRIWPSVGQDYSALRELARSLSAESKAAAERSDFDTSADLSIANVRVGTMLCRGGTPTDELVGDAIAGMGRSRLIEFRDKLSAAKSRRVIAALSQSLNELEPYDRIWARGRAIDEHTSGWEVRLEHVVYDFGFGDPTEPICRNGRRRMVATCQLLQTDVALQLFAQEHGRLPSRLDELVPTHLSQISIDPYSDRPLIYRPVRQSFVLYSVGSDRRDDNGKCTNWRTYHRSLGYDFDLDTATRP